TATEARVAVEDAAGRSQKMTIALPQSLRTGQADLGDLVVPDLDLLASGQVVSGEDAPLAGAHIVMMVRSEKGWRRDWSWHETTPITSDQGRFELRGKPVSAKPGLAAEIAGWMCVEAMPFEPGARDVKITLVKAGGIAGSIAGLDPDPRTE